MRPFRCLLVCLFCCAPRLATAQLTARDTAALVNAVAERIRTQFGTGDAREPSVITAHNPLALSDVRFAMRVSAVVHARDSSLIVAEPTRSTRRIALGAPSLIAGGPLIEIVGVVADTKYVSLRDSAQSIIYYPLAQQPADAGGLRFVIRTKGPAVDAIPAVKSAITGVSPTVALDIVPLERQLSESIALPRAIGVLSGIFAGLAVVLAAIGLYGLMAYSVARRRNEIGVRIALGAGMSRIVRMVLGDVGRLVTIGAVIGLALSFTARRLVVGFLYGIGADDIRTLVGSAGLLATIALLAAALPARRAASLDPAATLREE
jgi:hypothetical protein